MGRGGAAERGCVRSPMSTFAGCSFVHHCTLIALSLHSHCTFPLFYGKSLFFRSSPEFITYWLHCAMVTLGRIGIWSTATRDGDPNTVNLFAALNACPALRGWAYCRNSEDLYSNMLNNVLRDWIYHKSTQCVLRFRRKNGSRLGAVLTLQGVEIEHRNNEHRAFEWFDRNSLLG